MKTVMNKVFIFGRFLRKHVFYICFDGSNGSNVPWHICTYVLKETVRFRCMASLKLC